MSFVHSTWFASRSIICPVKAIEFEIIKRGAGLARAGVIHTPHGKISTPSFSVAATKAAVKALSVDDVKKLGGQSVLANTYHLILQPGVDVISQSGGLAKFMNWDGPTFTDSGGFQIFSLGMAYDRGLKETVKAVSKTQKNRVKVTDEGARFRSHIDGSWLEMTPESSMRAQHTIGSDIHMAFDQLTSPSAPRDEIRMAMERTHAWADRCLIEHDKLNRQHTKNKEPLQALYGVVQGAHELDLRRESASFLAKRNFDGFGIGGVFVPEEIPKYVNLVNQILPEDKPRHLLGMGAQPLDLFLGVENGIDTFDCVAPTRQARNGALYTNKGRINILNASNKTDFSQIDAECACNVCQNYSRAYLHHLFKSNEILASMLASQHNEFFVVNLVAKIRQAILDGNYLELKEGFLKAYY